MSKWKKVLFVGFSVHLTLSVCCFQIQSEQESTNVLLVASTAVAVAGAVILLSIVVAVFEKKYFRNRLQSSLSHEHATPTTMPDSGGNQRPEGRQQKLILMRMDRHWRMMPTFIC